MNAITGLAGLSMAGSDAAEVLARDGEEFSVLKDGEVVAARRAFSCLVEPEPGDTVLLGTTGRARYVLAVLERAGAAPMRLAVPDGTTLAAEDGRLRLAAHTLVMEAVNTQVATAELGVCATRTNARLGSVSAIAEAIETIATRIIGRFRRSYRFVEEGEHVRARDLDHRASGHLNLRADTATVQAGALVKLQGSQIHLG
jgi:hypothetical protein